MEAALISQSSGVTPSRCINNVVECSEQMLVEAARDVSLPAFEDFVAHYRDRMFDAGTVPDELLVLAARRGDGHAFEMLVYRHRAKMLCTAMRITRNAADAEDVVQGGFHKVFMHLQKFEGHSSFVTWLTSIVRNEALMLLRRRHFKVEIPLDQPNVEKGAASPLDFRDSSLNPEDRCSQQEQKEILSAAINKLKPGIRRAIELRVFSELSMEEIARIMGISVPAVKSRVLRGNRELEKVKRPMLCRQDFQASCERILSPNTATSACG